MDRKLITRISRRLAPLGLLFVVLTLVPLSHAQYPCTQLSQGTTPPWSIGLTCVFNSSSTSTGGFNVAGVTYWKVVFVPNGTVSAASLSFDSSTTGLSGSWSTGGILAAATIGSMTSSGSYGPNSSATTATNYGRLTPSITGSGSVQVILYGWVANPVAGGGGGCIATVATLSSSCGTTAGTLASVTDGSTTSDCTVGGGTNKNACIYTGSAWAYAGSGSSNATQINGAALPVSKAIVGTNSSGQVVDATSATLANNTTGTASNVSGTPTLPNGVTATSQAVGDNSADLSTNNFVQANGTAISTLGAAGTTVCDRFNTQAAAFPGQIISGLRDGPGTLFDCGAVDLVNAQSTFWLAGHTIYRTTNGFTLADRQVIRGSNIGNGGTSVSATTGTSLNAASTFPTAQTSGGGITTSGTNSSGASAIVIALAAGANNMTFGDGTQLIIAGDSTRYFITRCTAASAPPCVSSTSQFYNLIQGGAAISVNISPVLATSPTNGTAVHIRQALARIGDSSVPSGGSVQNTRLQNVFINGDSATATTGTGIGVLASLSAQENSGADNVYVRNFTQGFGIYGAHRTDWFNLNVAYTNSTYCPAAGAGAFGTVPFEVAPFLTTIKGLTVFADPCTPAELPFGLVHLMTNPVSSFVNGTADISNFHGELCGGSSGCGGGTITGDFFYGDGVGGSWDIHNGTGCPSGLACKNLLHLASTFLGVMNFHDVSCNNGTTNIVQDDVNTNVIPCSALLNGTGFYQMAIDGSVVTNMASCAVLTKGFSLTASGFNYCSGGVALPFINITPPAALGAQNVIFPGNGLGATTAYPGVPVNPNSETTCVTQTLSYLDRGSYIKCSGGTTATLTLPAASGNLASNLPFMVCNLNTGVLTITPTTPNNIDGGSSQASATLQPNYCAHIYQDGGSPINWWSIKLGTYGTARFFTEQAAPGSVPASSAVVYDDSTTHDMEALTEGSTTGGVIYHDHSHVNAATQTASISTATLCAAAAGACDQSAYYHISWSFGQGGTACSTVGSGGVSFQLTWTDAAGTAHTAVTIPMIDASSTSAISPKFTFQTSNAAAFATGEMNVYTNGSIIQYATTYTACTTGTGTYTLRATVTRLY